MNPVPNPFTAEDDEPSFTYYAYALNPRRTPRAGEVDVLVDSHAWADAVRACSDFCTYVHHHEQNLGRGTSEGAGAIHLFYQLFNTVPCSISVETYGYTVGITTDAEHLQWLGMVIPQEDRSHRPVDPPTS